MTDTCSCVARARALELYSDAVRDGVLELVSTQTADYVETARLRCRACGRQWLFTRDDSYHQPSVSWAKSSSTGD